MRIDVLTHIDRVLFDEAWPASLSTRVGGVAASVLCGDQIM